jgi:hypothetical protein
MRSRREADHATGRLLGAWRARDAAVLAGVLHRRVVFTADGLGAVADIPIRGVEAVTATLLHLTSRSAPEDLSATVANGAPAILLRASGSTRGVVVVEVRHGLVTRLWAVFSPRKLSSWR